jgi:hypothetical protein
MGDAIAQQGFVRGIEPSARESAEHVRAGRKLLALAGLEPRGYRTPSLRHVVGACRELSRTFDSWIAAGAVRAGSVRTGNTIRIDVHPDDFDARPSRTRALEKTLRRAAGRCHAVTYDELALAPERAVVSDVGRVIRVR